MKNKIYSIYLKIISACLVLLGFNACDSNHEDDEDNGGWVEYGTPSASYKVIGEVVSSETKLPVENIQVILTSRYQEGDTTYTDEKGLFEINKHDFPSNQLILHFKDVYEEAFANKNDTIDLKDVTFEGGGRWYQGHADIDVKIIELEPKEPEEPEEPETL